MFVFEVVFVVIEVELELNDCSVVTTCCSVCCEEVHAFIL